MNFAQTNFKPAVSFQSSKLFAYKKINQVEISLSDSKQLASQLLELMKREDVQSNIDMNCGFKLPDGSILTTNIAGLTLIDKSKRIDLSVERMSNDRAFNELFALFKDTLVAKSSTISISTLESIKAGSSGQELVIDKEDTHRLVNRLLKEIDNNQGGVKVLPSIRGQKYDYIAFSVGGKEVQIHPCGGYGEEGCVTIDTGELMSLVNISSSDFAKGEKNPVLELDQKIKDIVAQNPKPSKVSITSALKAQMLFR